MSVDPRFWNGSTEPTREQVLEEIARELAKRREVYPRWVAEKKLKQDVANQRIDRLQAGYDFIMRIWPPLQKLPR